MNKPKLLDGCCCEGVGALGYLRSGWHVTGLEKVARFSKRYPGHDFIVGDAIEYIYQHGHEYDAIHVSPDCQGYTIATAGNPAARAKYVRAIPAFREACIASGRPYIIENVEQARSQMIDPITLCGSMFGLNATDTDGTPLELRRHRLFESNIPLIQPDCQHGWYSDQVAGVYGGARNDKDAARHERHGGYVPASRAVKEQLLGVPADMFTLHGLQQGLPPFYTESLGRQMRAFVQGIDAAA